MGARVARMLRNFNIENRVHREISKEKPSAAPRHAVTAPPSAAAAAAAPGAAEAADSVHQKNEEVLGFLKSVYVESKDPAAEAPKTSQAGEEAERRPLKFSLPAASYGLAELVDVPKGKLTLTEALKALSSHQRQPHTWTPEKIAAEYTLELKDTKALLEFFVPFQVEIIPPKTEGPKQIKAS